VNFETEEAVIPWRRTEKCKKGIEHLFHVMMDKEERNYEWE